MISQIAIYGVLLFAAWMGLVGSLMLLAPDGALSILRMAGSTAVINVAEQVLRFSFGLAMIGAAPLSRFPDAFQWIGLFIAATSVLILLVPRRWHHGYAVWWADKLHPVVVRLLAPIAFAAALVLVYAVMIDLPVVNG